MDGVPVRESPGEQLCPSVFTIAGGEGRDFDRDVRGRIESPHGKLDHQAPRGRSFVCLERKEPCLYAEIFSNASFPDALLELDREFPCQAKQREALIDLSIAVFVDT